jgi:hypothetical protein
MGFIDSTPLGLGLSVDLYPELHTGLFNFYSFEIRLSLYLTIYAPSGFRLTYALQPTPQGRKHQ